MELGKAFNLSEPHCSSLGNWFNGTRMSGSLWALETPPASNNQRTAYHIKTVRCEGRVLCPELRPLPVQLAHHRPANRARGRMRSPSIIGPRPSLAARAGTGRPPAMRVRLSFSTGRGGLSVRNTCPGSAPWVSASLWAEMLGRKGAGAAASFVFARLSPFVSC